MPELNEIVTLVYEDGEEETFSVEDVMELDGNTYVILVPEEADAEAEENDEVDACIFKVETSEDGEEVLVDLDDDEYERVTEMICSDADECDESDEEDEEDEEGADLEASEDDLPGDEAKQGDDAEDEDDWEDDLDEE